MTSGSPKWRSLDSLDPWRGHLKTPKKVTGDAGRWGISNKMFIQLRSCNWNQILFWGPSSKGWVHASVTSRMTWHFAVTGNLNLNLHFLLLMGWGVRCNARVFVYYIKLAVLWYSLMNILEIFLSSPMAKLLQVFRLSSQWIQTTCTWSLDDPPFLHWIPDLIYTLRVLISPPLWDISVLLVKLDHFHNL